MEDVLIVRPMQYAAEGSTSAAPLTPAEIACLSEIRYVLQLHGCLHKFGVCRPSELPRLPDWQFMREDTDAERRILTSSPDSDRWGRQFVETQWVFSQKHVGAYCAQYCGFTDGRHYSDHAKQIGVDEGVRAALISSTCQSTKE